MHVRSPLMMMNTATEPIVKGGVGEISVGSPQSNFYSKMMFGSSNNDLFKRSTATEDDFIVSNRVDTAGGEYNYRGIDTFKANAQGRPKDINWQMIRTNNWYYMYGRMYQYREEVSVLSTIILGSVTELLRYNIIFKPKFAYKCPNCGRETQQYVDECPNPKCRTPRDQLIEPDVNQQKFFTKPGTNKSFIECANNNGKTLKDVLKMYASDEYLLNQAYLCCSTVDYYDPETGKRDPKRRIPREFIALDPMKVMALIDDAGEFNNTFAYCVEDREVSYSLTEDKDKLQYLSDNGKILYPAAWRVGSNIGATGQILHYSQDEIYQDQWFRPTLVYGVPIWYDIEDDLQAWHYLEKHFLKKYKYGFVRKILVMPGFSDDSVKGICKGITDTLARNDNSIPIVCTPPQMSGVAQMTAQALDLGTENSQDALAVKNEIMNRLCAHIRVPNLFAGDVEASGGMNNESQQITVYDRYLVDKMDYIDNILKWILSWFPEITDWELVLDRPTKSEADAKKRVDKIEEMMKMKQANFRIEYNGEEFHYSRFPMDQEQMIMQIEQMKMQMDQMKMQMAMPQMGAGEENEPGIFPGDGDGPPEKGTARREDADINASKDEVDQSMREAETH